jgi:hypothetical protein
MDCSGDDFWPCGGKCHWHWGPDERDNLRSIVLYANGGAGRHQQPMHSAEFAHSLAYSVLQFTLDGRPVAS